MYGTTTGGFSTDGNVFRITPNGTLATVFNFSPCFQNVCPGQDPVTGLIQAVDGDLYSTTLYGGVARNQGCFLGCGTLFKVSPGGTLTALHDFCAQSGCSDGAKPVGGLVQGASGAIYGTTGAGGAHGAGTIFVITSGGTLTTLHSFCSQGGCADGISPTAGLVRATDGAYYGTTYGGGSNHGGTIFKITPSGKLTTLHSFCAQTGCADGSNVRAGLIQATNGNFYGTTEAGGTNGAGTIFEITPRGELTTLYSFCAQIGCADGAHSKAALVQAANGDLYGTTVGGGTFNDGTVFSLSVH